MFSSHELPFFSASLLWSSHFLCLVQRKYTITKNLVWIRPDLRIFTKRKELQFKHAFVFFRIAISHEMTQMSLIISKNYKPIFRVFFSLDIFNFLDFFLPFDKILSLFLFFTSNFRFLSSYSIFFPFSSTVIENYSPCPLLPLTVSLFLFVSSSLLQPQTALWEGFSTDFK